MASVRDQLADLLGDASADPRWREQLEDLRYDGEEIRESVSAGDARVVVTSHRVLTFSPDTEGSAFRSIERPNVVGVSTGAKSERHLLWRGVRWSAIGLVLIGAGSVIDLDSMLGDVGLGGASGAGGVGLGGIMGVLQQMLDLMRQLDELLQVLGALVVLLGVVAVGAYLLTRDPRLVVEVAGDEEDDVALPRPEDTRDTIGRLERAIFPDDTGEGGSVPDDDPLREA